MFRYFIFLLCSSPLLALTTLHVTTNSDNNPGGLGEVGDLRYCLNVMNQDLNTTPDDFKIIFDFPMTIQLNGILPIINNSANPVNITIGNEGSIPTVTLDGNGGSYRGFFIPAGNVTIQNMNFQNLTANGGNGGNGISGGGGGLGAGAAIYAPESFLYGSNPSITLKNVSIHDCAAIGGNGGSYIGGTLTGNEGGGGGGGFEGHGGSITATGSTGGGGGGGFGGDGGDVTLSISDLFGGGGGGGGGLGSKATIGTPTNLGHGGSDQQAGLDGNGYGLSITAGSGSGGNLGGARAGGGGGGAGSGVVAAGGGGGGSLGVDGASARGSIPPGGSATPSGGYGGDGGGGGGAGVVLTGSTNAIDGQAGSGGYGGGGGGGSGTGAYDTSYSVQGGAGGFGGGGGGGGVNQSGSTSADGGNSLGGGGGGGGGTSNGIFATGGIDTGSLGGGGGGMGNNSAGSNSGGGGGGGGSGLGAAIFIDSNLNFTLEAISGIPTSFNTYNNLVQAGAYGTGGDGGLDGTAGSALGEGIFLRSGSSLTLLASDADDILTLGSGVTFVDDTTFGGTGTSVFVRGNGTVIYNGSTNYEGSITINNANLKVNGVIDSASISVCRNIGFSTQRGTLSGSGSLTGSVYVNSGIISPDSGETLTLGSLTLNSANPLSNTLGSLVHIEIDSSGTSLVSVVGAANLAGVLEMDIDGSAVPGSYTVLSSSGITGSFDSITFTNTTPSYSLSYLPIGAPTFVRFDLLGLTPSNPSLSTQNLYGNNLVIAKYLNRLAPDADTLGLTEQFDLLNNLSFSQYQQALQSISPTRNTIPTFTAQNVMFMFSQSLDTHFIKRRLASQNKKNSSIEATAFLAGDDITAIDAAPCTPHCIPTNSTYSSIWGMTFGQFSHQNAQDQTSSFDFNSGGFLAAYDYGNNDIGYIGALAGYAYTSISEYQPQGSAKINAGYASIYATKRFAHFFIDAALWGNYMHVNQSRAISFPGFNATAKSSYPGEQIDLHIGAGYDLALKMGTLEPFCLLDWVYEWDSFYLENSAAPYNMNIPSRNSSMLRFETGMNGYKTLYYDWGTFIAQTKLSYVYKKPYNVGHLNASIINAPASFVVEAFTVEQSLISPAIELFWQTHQNIYGSISYNGEFGSGYNSQQFYGKIGYAF